MRRWRMIFGSAEHSHRQEWFMAVSSGAGAFSEVAQTDRAALAFLYEHPQWFAGIFAELERRKVPFDKIFIPDHFYDIGAQKPAFKVLFNRMSPSANSRQHGSGIFHTLAYLEHLELMGVLVLNGAKAAQCVVTLFKYQDVMAVMRDAEAYTSGFIAEG